MAVAASCKRIKLEGRMEASHFPLVFVLKRRCGRVKSNRRSLRISSSSFEVTAIALKMKRTHSFHFHHPGHREVGEHKKDRVRSA